MRNTYEVKRSREATAFTETVKTFTNKREALRLFARLVRDNKHTLKVGKPGESGYNDALGWDFSVYSPQTDEWVAAAGPFDN